MSGLLFVRGLTAKLLGIPIIVFILGITIPGVMGYQLLLNSAQRETRDQAAMLLHTLEGVRRSVLATQTDKTPFTYASGSLVTQQAATRYFETAAAWPYSYRFVVANAPNPADRPDNYEAGLITTFEADHNLKKFEEESVKREGGHSFVYAVPVLAREIGVSTTKKDQVAGVAIIYVPTEYPIQQAKHTFWTLFSIILMLGGFCIGLLIWRSQGLVARPAMQMLQTSDAIRRGEWGACFQVKYPHELQMLAMSFQETTFWLRERIAREEKLRALFQQFIPASVAAKALGREADKILAGTSHSVTVVIINIRNFKLLQEHLSPGETVKALNEFFSQVNQAIVSNKGIVSKYLGDTVLAFFGMPLNNENHALQAVRAAMEMPRALRELYIRLEEDYGWELGVGIGITTGEPIVGHFGSSAHMEYTVLGEVVVEAHQLEEITKSIPEEDSIIISEETYRHIMSEVQVYDLGEKTMKSGKTIRAYSVNGFRSEARSVMAA